MPGDDTTFLLSTFGVSALAGMRSMSPPALLSLYLAHRRLPAGHSLAERISSKRARIILTTLALGEMAADKFPQAPNRTFLPALIGRAVTGGGVSGVLWSLKGRPTWIGALGGATASVANTFLTFHLRQWLGRTLPIPHALIWAGALEDAVIWLGGWQLLKASDKTADTP
jgi:uncharacterized membrane protein